MNIPESEKSMAATQSTQTNQASQAPTGVNPIWLFVAMGVIFTAIMIFELFFKAKH